MCGIVGYIGERNAAQIIMDGLRKLEYRGYDSAGVAVFNGGQLQVRKRVGKLQALAESLQEESLDGHIGIGHCLAPDTLIQLADGRVLPIAEIEGEVTVLSLDPITLQLVPRHAFAFHHHAPETLLEIRTPSSSVTCTAEHRMITIDAETGDLQERRASEIQPGDLLLFARRVPVHSGAESLQRFAEAIGFSASDKQQELEAIIHQKRPGFTISSKAIPLRKPPLLRRLVAQGVPRTALRPFKGKGYLTEAQGQKLVELLKTYPATENVCTLLQRYLDGDVVFQEVQAVREVLASDSSVYDLEVPGTENFIANGLISHNSRWATHGKPSERNAHPHADATGQVVVVQNGIVENFRELRAELEAEGVQFKSDTDTEVIVHLVSLHYQGGRSLAEAVRLALGQLRGPSAVVALSSREPGTLVAARLGNAGGVAVGYGDGEMFIASDMPAILEHTRRMVFLENRQMAVLTRDGATFSTLDGQPFQPEIHTIPWDPVSAAKGKYRHFMQKEIYEQANSLTDTIRGRVDLGSGEVYLEEVTLTPERAQGLTQLVSVACGTSYHSELVGQFMFEQLARLPVRVDYASEFRYRDPVIDDRTLLLAITQSGETVDTLAAMEEGRDKGAHLAAIVNVIGSQAARVSDSLIYMHAGPEIGVASTKAFTASIVDQYLLAIQLGTLRGTLSADRRRGLLDDLARLPALVGQLLDLSRRGIYEELAQTFFQHTDFLYLGRGIHFPIALEGALKLKEISYIHAEGYPAGEMKHGPIALIDEQMPVVAIATQDRVYDKMISQIEQVKARGGTVLAVATEGDVEVAAQADHTLCVPATSPLLAPVLTVLPMQLYAYHMAVQRGCDVDQPRNLAKSVTVE